MDIAVDVVPIKGRALKIARKLAPVFRRLVFMRLLHPLKTDKPTDT